MRGVVETCSADPDDGDLRDRGGLLAGLQSLALRGGYGLSALVAVFCC